jgi:hypothetical protein
LSNQDVDIDEFVAIRGIILLDWIINCRLCQEAQVDNAIILKKNKLKKKGHAESAKSPK